MAKLLRRAGTDTAKFSFEITQLRFDMTMDLCTPMSAKWVRGPRTVKTSQVYGQGCSYIWENEGLKMICTMYKKKDRFQKKKSKITLKQVVDVSTKTVGFVEIDLADWCFDTEKETTKTVALSKCKDKKAKLAITIRSRWLKEIQTAGEEPSMISGVNSVSDDSDDSGNDGETYRERQYKHSEQQQQSLEGMDLPAEKFGTTSNPFEEEKAPASNPFGSGGSFAGSSSQTNPFDAESAGVKDNLDSSNPFLDGDSETPNTLNNSHNPFDVEVHEQLNTSNPFDSPHSNSPAKAPAVNPFDSPITSPAAPVASPGAIASANPFDDETDSATNSSNRFVEEIPSRSGASSISKSSKKSKSKGKGKSKSKNKSKRDKEMEGEALAGSSVDVHTDSSSRIQTSVAATAVAGVGVGEGQGAGTGAEAGASASFEPSSLGQLPSSPNQLVYLQQEAEAVVRLTQQLQDKEDQLARLKGKVRAHVCNNSAREQELEVALERIRRERKKEQAEAQAWQAERTSLLQQLQGQQVSGAILEGHTTAQQELQQSVQQLQAQVDAAALRNAELEDVVSEQGAIMSQQQASASAIRSSSGQAEDEVHRLKAANAASSSKVQQLQEQIAALGQNTGLELQRLNSQVMLLSSENEKLRARHIAFEELSSGARGFFSSSLAEAKERNLFYEQQLKEADQTLLAAKASWETSTAIMAQQLSKAEAAVSSLREERGDLQESLTMDQAKFSKLKSKLRKALKAKDKMSELFSRFEVELVQKKVDLVNETDRSNELEMANQQLRAEITQLVNTNSKLRLKLHKLAGGGSSKQLGTSPSPSPKGNVNLPKAGSPKAERHKSKGDKEGRGSPRQPVNRPSESAKTEHRDPKQPVAANTNPFA